MLPSLDEFLKNAEIGRSWVDHVDFANLYLRKTSRYVIIDGKPKRLYNVLDLASLEAKTPGNGAFTALVEKLERDWNGPLFVESVLSEKFASSLIKMGFLPVNLEENWGGFPHHFVKHTDKGQNKS